MATILAADIGGTNSRFGHFEAVPGSEAGLVDSRSFPTSSVRSLPELLRMLAESGFGLTPAAADRIVLAVAGPVLDGARCRLTNAAWGIDLDDPSTGLPRARTVLINDFVAQALGCGTAHAALTALDVQSGDARHSGGRLGVTAALGAGTGLGHCALVPLPGGGVLPVPSEGGHAPLAFVDEEEFAFLAFLKKRTGHSHAFGDVVVSGAGLSSLHEFLTGRRLTPAEVAAEIGPDSETTCWFARFYARACRAYALHVLAWGGLFLCGGLAAKNPFLVDNAEFLREFRDCPAYGAQLAGIPVRLVTVPDTGLHGAARYGGMLRAEQPT
ncbi:Glucokinase [anaerobic digester metagenome]